MGIGFDDVVTDESLELLVPSSELLPDQRAFINAYLMRGSIRGAVKASKIHHLYHYKWKDEDANYQAAFARAEAVVLDDDIASIRKRGIEGWDEPLDNKGRLTGDVKRRFSDNLAMFYIKAKNPSFKDSHKPSDVTINIGSDSKVQFNFDQFRQLLK
jgi:hypothetical protein